VAFSIKDNEILNNKQIKYSKIIINQAVILTNTKYLGSNFIDYTKDVRSKFSFPSCFERILTLNAFLPK
jgi:hypothetical protein